MEPSLCSSTSWKAACSAHRASSPKWDARVDTTTTHDVPLTADAAFTAGAAFWPARHSSRRMAGSRSRVLTAAVDEPSCTAGSFTAGSFTAGSSTAGSFTAGGGPVSFTAGARAVAVQPRLCRDLIDKGGVYAALLVAGLLVAGLLVAGLLVAGCCLLVCCLLVGDRLVGCMLGVPVDDI